jgi:hypothetical protein
MLAARRKLKPNAESLAHAPDFVPSLALVDTSSLENERQEPPLRKEQDHRRLEAEQVEVKLLRAIKARAAACWAGWPCSAWC